MTRRQQSWFKIALRWQGSVIPAVMPRTLLCGGFGFFLSYLHSRGFPVASWPALGSLIPNLVLGLLLVFRTNTAYERYWEGRKLWGILINTVRNLARQIWVAVGEVTANDRLEKITMVRLLPAFAIATKLHLRQQPMLADELAGVLSPDRIEQLQTVNNPPLEVAFWIGDYLQAQHDRGGVNAYQLTAMQELLNTMVDAMGGCERILRTPIPLAYAIHLKQLLLIYCLSLPFQFISEMGWFTGLAVAIISFTLFGIEEIGIEIEDPFGSDANDLPLDRICETMSRNIEDLILMSSSHRTVAQPIGNNES